MMSTVAGALCALLLVSPGIAFDDETLLQMEVQPHSSALKAGSEAAIYSKAMSMTISFLRSRKIAYMDVASNGAHLESESEFRVRPSFPMSATERGAYGFYLHTFGQPKACIMQLRSIRNLYPAAPVYVMSDGGMNFTGICQEIGNCEFRWKPAANDRWNPKPFLARFKEAAQWLRTEYVVMLEPDVQIHGPIIYSPNQDAGGLRDANPKLKDGLRAYMEGLGRQATGQTYTLKWEHFGLAGGMYVKTAAVLDSFDAGCIDWAKAAKLDTHRVFSSDVAMPIVLASQGYNYAPWDAVFQTGHDAHWKKMGDDQSKPDRSFQHFGREEVKPYYGEKPTEEESLLVSYMPKNRVIGQIGCQGCVWVNDDVCLKQANLACPTSEPPAPRNGCPKPLDVTRDIPVKM